MPIKSSVDWLISQEMVSSLPNPGANILNFVYIFSDVTNVFHGEVLSFLSWVVKQLRNGIALFRSTTVVNASLNSQFGLFNQKLNLWE